MAHDAAEEAFRRAERGDFIGIDAHLGQPGAESPWQLALRAIYAMTLPGRLTALPTIAEIEAHGVTPGAVRARQQVDLAAFLHLRAIEDAPTPSIGSALRPFYDGDLESAESLALSLAERAARDGDAALRVDAESVAALAATSEEDAVARARRASRMARSEGLLQQEYLANLILARVRRRNHRAHLSVRILTSLAQVVPEVWQRQVGLELAFAGGAPTQRGEAPLAGLLAAAEAGDAEAFDTAARAAEGWVAACSPVADELATWLAMIRPRGVIPDHVLPWATGITHEAPRGIRDTRRGESRSTWVLAAPGARPRRLLGSGLPLFGEAQVIRSGRRGTRTEEAISSLLLADAGMDETRFFESVYGFAYEKARHDDVFRGLVHRMRGALGEAAEIVRADGRVTVSPRAPLVIEDPRCEEPLADRVLDRLAACNGRATAKELTTALRVPLRTVQRALGQLVEEGACLAEPDGRKTEYVVEDTTFNEPSLHRLRGQRD